MGVRHCFTTGFRRVLASPSLIFWVYLAGVVVALPLTAVLRGALKESFGASLVSENLRQGFDLGWHGEFASSRSGLSTTFGPEVIGVMPVLSNLDRMLGGALFAVDGAVLGAGFLFLLAWAFFAGGIVSRFARPEEPFSRPVFFSNSAAYFFRFLRLIVLSLTFYWVLFRWVARPLGNLIERVTVDTTREWTVILYTGAVYLLVGFLLVIGNLAVDYAKISMVVQRGSSALLGLLRGLRFVASTPRQSLGLYLSLLLVGALLLTAYGLIAPGPGQSSNFTLIGALLVSQVFIIARVTLKLWFLASQTILFRSAEDAKPRAAVAPVAAAPVA